MAFASSIPTFATADAEAPLSHPSSSKAMPRPASTAMPQPASKAMPQFKAMPRRKAKPRDTAADAEILAQFRQNDLLVARKSRRKRREEGTSNVIICGCDAFLFPEEVKEDEELRTKQRSLDSQQRLTNMEGQLEAVVQELRGSRKRRRNETDLPVTGGSSTPPAALVLGKCMICGKCPTITSTRTDTCAACAG